MDLDGDYYYYYMAENVINAARIHSDSPALAGHLSSPKIEPFNPSIIFKLNSLALLLPFPS